MRLASCVHAVLIHRWFHRVASGKRLAVGFLLFIQAGLIAYSATRHSPTDLESAFLASGISHWTFGRFEAFRGNPPQMRMVAALPVIAVGYKMSWLGFRDVPGSRIEYQLGREFLNANEARSIPLFFYARWACIPFSLIGAYFAFCWAKELYGIHAGFLALVLYVFEPNLLAHGELVTPDATATAFGIMAGYAFWRWLKRPSLSRAGLAGFALGLAELSKMTWLLLFGLWPVLWLIWRWLEPCGKPVVSQSADTVSYEASSGEGKEVGENDGGLQPSIRPSFTQLAVILLLGIYLINLGYAFDGSGIPLRDFQFVSKSLTGLDKSGSAGNRFRDTVLGGLPVPLPKDFVLGIDTQKKDFEGHYLPSYLRGEWKKHGGWWYYYLYGLLVKVPCGTWGLFFVVILSRVCSRNRPVPLRDELVLLIPALAVLVFVSSQTAFNHHVRYVFPSLGLALIFVGQASRGLASRLTVVRWATVALLLESLVALTFAYPHHLAYFNLWAGGSRNGHKHLLGSSLDWGQDLLFLREHVLSTGDVVEEVRGSYINPVLFRTMIPNFASKTAVGKRIIVVSPNCMLTGGVLPAGGWQLTPTLWIIRQDDSVRNKKLE